MRLIEKVKENNYKIYKVVELEKEIGAVEIIEEKDHIFIENIFLQLEFRGQGFLRKILQKFSEKPIKCLPLQQHRKKFEHLGFQICEILGEDIYYLKA